MLERWLILALSTCNRTYKRTCISSSVVYSKQSMISNDQAELDLTRYLIALTQDNYYQMVMNVFFMKKNKHRVVHR